MLRWIMFLIAGYKIYDLVQGARDKISFEFLRPKSGDVNLLDEKLTLRIRITNRNPIGFPINGVTGVISQAGIVFGKVESTNVHDIPANGSVDLMTIVNITSENVLKKLADNLITGQWTQPIEFNGTIMVRERVFQVRRQINF